MPESSLVVRIDGADAERSARSLDKSLNKLSKSGGKVDNEFKDVNQTASKTSKVFGGVKKSVSGLQVALAGLGIGALTGAILANTQRQQAAISAVESRIVSTGKAAGFTTEQLQEMAAGFQQATSVGDEEILEFQSILLTFTKVTGDAFEGATEAVLDMATVMGTDFKSAAVQVGKALNDPIKGVNAMSRAGVQFSDTQKEVIKNLVETGQTAKAQAIILEELQVQFGGAAAAAKNTFAGSLKSVQNAFGDLLEAEGGLDDATEALLDLEDLLSDPDTKAAANELTAALISGFTGVVKVLTEATQLGREFGKNLFNNVNPSRIVKLWTELNRVNQEIVELDKSAAEGSISLDQYKEEIAGLTSEAFTLKEQIEDAREEAEKPIKSEITEERKEVFEPSKDKIIDSIVPPEEESKIKGIIQALKQQRDTIGLTNKEIQLYKLQLEGASEAELKQASAILDNIEAKQRDILLTKQQEEADEAAIEAIEEENKAIEEQSKLLSDYAASIDPVLAVEKQRVEELEKLNAALDLGLISQEAYNRRLQEFEEAALDAALATGQLTKEQQAFEGAKAALDDYAKTATDTFTQVKDAVTGAFNEAEDALVEFAKTGKLEFSDLVDSILDDLLRMQIKEGITGPLSQAFSGALGGSGSTPTAGTGTADNSGGLGGFSGLLGGLSSLFGAQRGASFKIPNAGTDNQLLMLRARAGEGVDITPAAQSASGGGQAPVTKNFFFTNNFNGVSDMGSFKQNEDQINNALMQEQQESERNL